MLDLAGKWMGLLGGAAGLVTAGWTLARDASARRLSIRSKISCTTQWGGGALEVRIRFAAREPHTTYSVTARLLNARGCDFRQINWNPRLYEPGQPDWEAFPGPSLGVQTAKEIDDRQPEDGSAVFLINGLFEQDLSSFRLRLTVREDASNRVVAKRVMEVSVPDLH